MTKPSPGSLLEAVQRPVEAADMRAALGVYVAGGLLIVDGLHERAVEEGVVDVKLMNRPLVGECNGVDGAHGGQFHDRTERLLKINTGSLREAAEDPTRLVSIQGAIGLQLVSKNPFTCNHISTSGTWNKDPCVISVQGGKLVLHSEAPVVIIEGHAICLRDW